MDPPSKQSKPRKPKHPKVKKRTSKKEASKRRSDDTAKGGHAVTKVCHRAHLQSQLSLMTQLAPLCVSVELFFDWLEKHFRIEKVLNGSLKKEFVDTTWYLSNKYFKL